ncbi:MAG: alpha/beta fold hydrolase, partial [Solimonas sp.]
MPHLKDRFGTLAVDLPGYGGSDPVPDEPRGRAALMGAAVARLIEGCEQPVRVAGHSYGGVVALQAALQVAPGAIESVVLFEPVFFRALQLTDDPALGPATEHFEDYVGRARAGEDGAVRLMIDYWFGKDAYGRLPDPVRSYLDANARCNALDVLSSFNDTATVGRLANLSAPV